MRCPVSPFGGDRGPQAQGVARHRGVGRVARGVEVAEAGERQLAPDRMASQAPSRSE